MLGNSNRAQRKTAGADDGEDSTPVTDIEDEMQEDKPRDKRVERDRRKAGDWSPLISPPQPDDEMAGSSKFNIKERVNK